MFSWLFSDPLPVGTPAPEFSLPDDAGRPVALSGLRGKGVVLVFYPGDDTPGCTKQLCEFRDSWDAVRKRGVEVYGVKRTVYLIGPDGMIRFARRGMPKPSEVLATV